MDALLQSLRDNSRSKYWFWIEDECEPGIRPETSVSAIQSAVAWHFNVTVHDLKSRIRTRPEVFVRWIAMYLVQTLTDLPHDKIGKHFGKSDHSASIYGCKKIKKMLREGHPVSRDIEQIKARLLVASASKDITISNGADHDGKQLGRTA